MNSLQTIIYRNAIVKIYFSHQKACGPTVVLFLICHTRHKHHRVCTFLTREFIGSRKTINFNKRQISNLNSCNEMSMSLHFLKQKMNALTLLLYLFYFNSCEWGFEKYSDYRVLFFWSFTYSKNFLYILTNTSTSNI